MLASVFVLPALACGTSEVAPPPEPAAPVVEAPVIAEAPIETPHAAAPRRVSLEGRRASIPAGISIIGSEPGTPFRRPSREADRVEVALGAFEMDRRPYPNDPTLAPLLVRSRAEAESLCAENAGRLCGELEWERACSGPESAAYTSGASLSLEECMRDPASCASGFGLIDMGVEHAEWTASDLPEGSIRMGRSAVIRGARSDQPADFHRCAARTEQVVVDAPAMAFHCCYGAPNTMAYPAPEMVRQFNDAPIELSALREVLSSVPELAAWAADFVPYGTEDGDRALARGNATRDALAGWELAQGPFRWSPTAGEETLVMAGRSGEDTLIAVLYPRDGGRYTHAASFVFEAETVPVAIARTPPTRSELLWTACQGCGGESGAIRMGEDGVIRVAAR
jgi:hypothetical protein